MDQHALALARAIRQAETGGAKDPYNAKGASGENGAFQFMPDTWKGWSKQYLGQENAPLTVENQNKVAYSRVKELKDQGLTPAQIASSWNSGRTDAYKQDFKGTNSQGVSYDVPQYVAKVSQFYKQFRPQDEQQQKPQGRYDVAPNRANQLANAQSQAQQAQAEADKYKGLGFFKQAGKEFINTIAPGQVGLGKTIQKTFGNQRDTYSQSIEMLSQSQVDLAKKILEKEARGEDTTQMKQIFNQNADQMDELQRGLAEESEIPTTKQVVGQIAQTGLDLATVGTYGKLTKGMKAGQRGKANPSALTNLTKDQKFLSRPTAKAVATGTGIGYGYDVTMGLMDGERAPYLPGVGTAVGTTLPLVGRAGVSRARPQASKQADLVTKAERELSKIEQNNATLRKFNQFSKDAPESRRRIITSDVLVDSVDGSGTIQTKGPSGAVQQYKKMTIDNAEQLVRRDLEREGSKISVTKLERKLNEVIESSKLPASEKQTAFNKVQKEIAAFKKDMDSGGFIPLTRLQDEKTFNYDLINFQTTAEKGAYRKALARGYKEAIQETSNLPVEAVNKEIGKYLSDIKRLELLDGKKVKGGRLGKYFAQISGNIVGAAVGSSAGPGGAAVGTIFGGEVASKIQQILMQGTFGRGTGVGLEKSPVIQSAIKRADSPRLQLPAQTTPFKKVQTSGATIPLSAPKVKASTPTVSNVAGKNIAPQTKNLLPAGKLPAGFKAPSEGQINLPKRTQSSIDSKKPSVIRRSDSQSKELGSTKTIYNTPSKITTNAIDKVSDKPPLKASGVINSDGYKINPKVEPAAIVALKKNEKFAAAMSELEALTDISEAGSRNFIGYGGDFRVTANTSTFPKWIPSELRSKKLMEKTIKHFEDGTVPRKNARREQELYKEFADYIETRVETGEEKSLKEFSGSGVIKALRDFFNPDLPNKQGGFIKIGSQSKKALPKSKVNESVSSLNNSIDLKTKREVVLKDLAGQKVTVPSGAVIQAGTTKSSNMIVEVNGKQFTVNKNQYQNLKGQSLVSEARDFAPELKGTEEKIKGTLSKKGQKQINDKLDELLAREKVVIAKAKEFTSKGKDAPDNLITEMTTIGDTREKLMKMKNASDTTKYSQYTLPNGENYREILIQAPKSKQITPAKAARTELKKEGITFEREMDGGVYPMKNGDMVDYDMLPTKTQRMIDVVTGDAEDFAGFQAIQKADFKSSHWDEPNVISHIRMNDRTYKGGKLAFMEELQSDWARELRSGNTKESNPLLKNWQEPTIKRALKDAVDADAKYFAWINGEQTSARYNLATHVDDVKWYPDFQNSFSSKKTIHLNPKGSSGKIKFDIDSKGTITAGDRTPADWNGKKLDEVLGKGLADKIMEKESGTLAGDGLKFGGEWASNLYDKQVKNIVEDLTGAKVKQFDLGLPVGEKTKQFVSEEWGTHLTFERMKAEGVGLEIRPMEGGDVYVVTDFIGDGKFKAVEKRTMKTAVTDKLQDASEFYVGKYKKMDETELFDKFGKNIPDKFKESFDISNPTTKQLGIELTPEIIAKIKGEAPTFATGKKPALPVKEIAIPSIILFLMNQKDE